MPMKEWFRKLRPVQLYIVLGLSIVFFITELAISHITHALTLLMDSYHMLCNVLVLSGCIITVKYGEHEENSYSKEDLQKSYSSECIEQELTKTKTKKKSPSARNQEKKLKNTFGWARIDVIVMLICCVLLASLSLSLVVEAVQTLVHITHQHEMHQPVIVFIIGFMGLILNAICYILIGGYTFHQGSFLYVNESGDVILDKVVTDESVRKGERRLSRTRTVPPPQNRQRQGTWEMARDIVGCIFVMICAILIYFTKEEIAKFIDPILSIFSSTILMIMSYPYMKESCLILLQTIPNSMNIDALKKQLLDHFPDIINVHDFHVWQLTADKVISTVHIIFQNPKVYAKIMNEIKAFFLENGITQVTIQPEFFRKENIASDKNSCLMKCQSEGCKTSHCCPEYVVEPPPNLFSESPSKEIVYSEEGVDLKSVTIDSSELPLPKIVKFEEVSEKIDELIDKEGQIIKKDVQAETIEERKLMTIDSSELPLPKIAKFEEVSEKIDELIDKEGQIIKKDVQAETIEERKLMTEEKS